MSAVSAIFKNVTRDNCITVTGRLNLGLVGIHKGKGTQSGLEQVSTC